MGMQLQLRAGEHTWAGHRIGRRLEEEHLKTATWLDLFFISPSLFLLYFVELCEACGLPILQYYWAKLRVVSAAVPLLVGAAWKEGCSPSVLALCMLLAPGAIDYPAPVECRPTNSRFFCQKRPGPRWRSKTVWWLVNLFLTSHQKPSRLSMDWISVPSTHPCIVRIEAPLNPRFVCSLPLLAMLSAACLHEMFVRTMPPPVGRTCTGSGESEEAHAAAAAWALFIPILLPWPRGRGPLGALIGRPAHP